MKHINALSLFSGIGGFEVGTSSLGFSFKKFLEWDKKCCETAKQNISIFKLNADIEPTDITKTLPKDFHKGKIDYIFGGPPCQSFSAAGRRAGGVRGINDTRGSLFFYYCQYVKHFHPKAFVFENVRGILSSKGGKDFQIICDSFKKVGYRLHWRVLNAADFGVPQTRERLFLVGIRRDIDCSFKFPRPTHGPNSLNRTPFVNAGDALDDLCDDNEIAPPYGGKYGHLIPAIPEGENYRFYTEEMGHPNPLFAWRSKFSGFLFKLSRKDLSKTIVAYQSRYDGPFHWKNRKCTIQELKRLQGFPDNFVIPHSYTEAVKQIGNSVCPPVAAQLGKALRYQIEGLNEFEVPLLEENEKLSSNSRMGDRAKQSKSKIKVRYNDIKQGNLFNTDSAKITVALKSFNKTHKIEDRDVRWKYKEGSLHIEVAHGNNTEGQCEISLQLYGGVASLLETVSAKSRSPLNDQDAVRILWSEIHNAIQKLTSYDSLLPLYGHFTEPYPKFDITFTSNLSSGTTYFQKLACDKKTLNRVLAYDVLSEKYGEPEQFLKSMREYGFDVRTHNTNRTIPKHHFRVCYPFTSPKNIKTYVLWTDKDKNKKTDFNIRDLMT